MTSQDTNNTSDCSECPSTRRSNKDIFFWKRISYTTRVTLSFALIAAMTALVAVGVLSFVWEDHFRAYTRDNLQNVAGRVAQSTATKLSSPNGAWYNDNTFQPARSALSIYPGLAIQVISYDEGSHVVFDSTRTLDPGNTVNLLPPSNANVVSAPIYLHDSGGAEYEAGMVEVWVVGSDLLLRSSDQLFRDQSYQAMFFAAALAILLASGIGFLFARSLVNPINCMTKTAREIKKGDLTARTGLSGDDEISRLGMTFDEMAESIERDHELERRLTTDVAHELRTPLMAIQSTVEAMIDGVFEPTLDRLQTINSEVQRLGRLVDALLRLSRLENRSKPVEMHVLNVGDLISGIITTHEAFVKDSGLTLKYETEEEVLVLGNADMLRQATANLISNAVRYTPEGGIITVRVAKAENMASIVVQDTGIGLSPEEVKMVFSRFWRADAGRNRASGGLGIGLAVVKEIVDQHDGWIHVEGKPNEGAQFTIYVPLYHPEEEHNQLKFRGTGKLKKINQGNPE